MAVTAPHLAHFLPPLPTDRSTWDDGYEWMGMLTGGWAVVPTWGQNGWDMGSWPLIIAATCVVTIPNETRPPRRPWVCAHCAKPIRPLEGSEWADEAHEVVCAATGGTHRPARQIRAYGVATYVESDIEVNPYATPEDRTVALDEIAALYWRLHQSHGPVNVPPIGPLVAEHTGPFSWERLNGTGP